ncbi:MAG: HAMP domain-containing sensor histidine kinase [Flavobacteriales bacterium]|nr:HAMP domain-containing histidine kinase [Flavobacteriales bacterium]MCB0809790.1 HAMP domain-containing histidine kinase [Flavobacteriales bacterium]MCB9180982.1 HAMP domain-containing histidine kinase [Flavobacteriales bacterium]HPF66780.1 HAMP domain-containing sensor histidine kinase [Flavobacteriales bacterium]HPQ57473.1 HAMP domain-containing sensor histidine kinase [Flavobacteriales bacterium]
MSRRVIGTVILLASLSVLGVLLTQLLWLDTAFQVQRQQLEIQRRQHSQLEKQFNDRVVIALTNVTERILSINKDPSDLFDAVKQVRPNYFAVTINDTLHPYLLESLLRREFERRNINEDFEYGIYDCFTDSIVYGSYVSLTDSVDPGEVPHSELLKLDKDGHYFGVFFPRREGGGWDPERTSASTWIFPAIVTSIVFLFFAYSVWVILRQKRLSEIKNDFIGNMTHELKTPISTIALSSEVLSDPDIVQEPERLRSYARIIREENERLRAQVERVLQLATLDRENLHLKREEVDLHTVVHEVAGAMKLTLEERKGSLTLELQATRSVVRGDRMHLGNVVRNLLDNAIKYCTDVPVIVVRTRDRNGSFLLEVRDNGIGIRKEDLRHVFERFYRVPTGNVHNVKGFGLGLHYVKQIAEAHQGHVDATSTPGRGSTFRLELPLLNERRS